MPKCRVLQTGVCLITQPFHYKENGWDYAHLGMDLTEYSKGYSALGYIVAHSEGTVISIRTNSTGYEDGGSYGNYVLLKHSNGYETMYAHLAYGTVKVSYGQKVSKGQVLAYMDNTGYSFGGHLHFEVRNPNGVKINPYNYLNADLPGMKKELVWQLKWHLYDPNNKNKMLTGWQKVKNKWYHLDQNGIMNTGWYWDSGYKKWFLLSSNGDMLTGWQKVSNKWYYMQPKKDNTYVEGAMRTGWFYDPGYKKWFLLSSNGDMLTGWQTVNGKKYYLWPTKDSKHVTGEMVTGKQVIGGKTYTFDSKGALIS